MLERLFTQKMLSPTDLSPMRENTRVVGTFNPGAAAFNGGTVLMVRVVEEVTEQRDGFLASPRIDESGQLTVDWLARDEIDLADPRVYTNKHDGSLRLRFISHFKVLHAKDGKTIDRLDGPVVMPEGEYEEYGIEDPRITQIGGTYYITYVAVSRHGVVTMLMSTTDFSSFRRHGVIFCPDNKDVVLFPQKIVGNYVAMHRPMPSMKFTIPKIWLARSTDLIHWGGHEQLLDDHVIDSERIGGGTPPIATEEGWLTIYHGNDKIEVASDGRKQFRYTAGALLLDHDNPKKVLGHSTEPIMTPTEPFETRGFVDNVVFPTAVVDRDGQYLVYYGAADEHVGVVGYDKDALLGALD